MPDPIITAPPQTTTVTAAPPPQMDTDQSQPTGTIPAQPTGPVPAQNPPPSAQQANISHSAMVGHAFKSILSSLGGSSTQYQQTPNGPVPVQVKNSPGDFFRNILAGAVVGAGAGAEAQGGAGSGWRGAGAGINAVEAQKQQQQQAAQKQAQQQFENKRAADKDAQEATAADTENQVRKAQLAQANAETLRTNLLTQGASYDLHQKIADADQARIKTYTDAGVKPVFEDIPESQMNDYVKNHPGASALDWRHSGVKTVTDTQGNPSYEYTLSAYDPKQPLPLSKATIDQWDKDGLFKYHPEYKDVATAGKTLTVGQFTALDRQAQNYAGQQTAQQMKDLELQHIKGQIDETKAAVSEHYTQSRLANLSIQEKQEAMSEKKRVDTAWEHLAAVGNDPDKLTDSQDRIALAKAVVPVLAEVNSSLKEAEANQETDPDAKAALPDLWAHQRLLSKLTSLAPKTQSADAAAPPTDFEKGNPPTGAGIPETRYDAGKVESAVALAQKLPKEQALAALWSAPTLSAAEKKAVYMKMSQPVSSPTPSMPLPNASER